MYASDSDDDLTAVLFPQEHTLSADDMLLVVQFSLEDLDDPLFSPKGKSRDDTPPSDLDIAMQEQKMLLEGFQRTLRDQKLAQSIGAAITADQDMLGLLSAREQAEQDDRQASLALSRGEPLPRETQSQRSLSVVQTFLEAHPKDSKPRSTAAIGPVKLSTKSRPYSYKTPLCPPAPTPKAGPSEVERAPCSVCMDRYNKSSMCRAPCGDLYCTDCLVNLVETCTHDESLFPIRCHRQHIPEDLFLSFLPSDLQRSYRDKVVEFGCPASQRVYCANPVCSIFLGPGGEERGDLICNECHTSVCTGCREPSHPGDQCGESEAVKLLETLAGANRWRHCGKCNAIVELNAGCHHITCRCRHEFCYLCGAKWKTCVCDAWDERRLVYDAERRVNNEHGEEAAAREPERHVQRVQRAVERLRVDHECWNHRWTGCRAGTCEECGHEMTIYLKRCKNCQLRVCKMCANNRL